MAITNPPAPFMVLHGPNGVEIHVKTGHLVVAHQAEPGSAAGAQTTIYLSNGMQWHVTEALSVVLAHA